MDIYNKLGIMIHYLLVIETILWKMYFEKKLLLLHKVIYNINLLCYLIPRNNCIGRAFSIFYYLQAVFFY